MEYKLFLEQRLQSWGLGMGGQKIQQKLYIAAIPIETHLWDFLLDISDWMDAGYKAIKIHVKFNYNH